ncbi:hypothetical protein WI41_17635 [Burkholderia latens]|uniref:Uncharacterized protein n=1 Tax=Burkholderia latens TaxID=488446 RepID=A0AAP1C3E0_9BURK|nr:MULTISPECIES: hypothetical protein [Burkholderia]AOK06964.1 hypothetical protein WK25_20645 [Burkholderia latens]KVA05760.1 hypothetical protein WI41_17635 [Burkholderia latens]MCA8310868.1 DUF2617 family protein [Burkholderia sp. AU28942]QTO51541.1 hypothetical protein J8I86_19190 [Burkholderia latens]
MKVAVGADTVTGFAGDVRTARALIDAYGEARALKLDARKAVSEALISVTPCETDADVLFAFYESERPCLLHVNVATSTIEEVSGLIQLGSTLPSGQHEWTTGLVSSLQNVLNRLGSHPLHVERIFSQLVAALQSYGVHDYLPQHGVGGAFIAAWVTPDGVRWQGDHLYVIHGEIPSFDDIMCATMIREEALCLVNNQISGTKVITSRRPLESDVDARARAKLAASNAEGSWDNAQFDYFVSINKSRHIVTVLEMRREQHHGLLSLHAPNMENSIGIVWSEAFVNLANKIEGVEEPSPEYMTVKFLPFREASEELRAAREQFAWEQFVDWRRDKG